MSVGGGESWSTAIHRWREVVSLPNLLRLKISRYRLRGKLRRSWRRVFFDEGIAHRGYVGNPVGVLKADQDSPSFKYPHRLEVLLVVVRVVVGKVGLPGAKLFNPLRSVGSSGVSSLRK